MRKIESTHLKPAIITSNFKRSTNCLILSVTFKHSDIELVGVLDLSVNSSLFQTPCALESASSLFASVYLKRKIKSNYYVSVVNNILSDERKSFNKRLEDVLKRSNESSWHTFIKLIKISAPKLILI